MSFVSVPMHTYITYGHGNVAIFPMDDCTMLGHCMPGEEGLYRMANVDLDHSRVSLPSMALQLSPWSFMVAVQQVLGLYSG